MPRKREAKRQWTDPVILVPIITAVIASIVGPTYYYYFLTPKPTEEPTPTAVTPKPTEELDTPPAIIPQPESVANITLDTDKSTYGVGDLVRVSGTLDEPVQGKTVRLDVYDPEGNVFQPFNETFNEGPQEDWSPAYPRLSDIQVQPNDKGLFSYRFPIDQPVLGSVIKGIYKIEATYDDMTGNATFTVR